MTFYEELDKYDLPELVTHWTSVGVFTMEAVIVGGSTCWQLYHREELLGTYLHPSTASNDLAAGVHDDKIGVQTSGLNIPACWEDWNNLE